MSGFSDYTTLLPRKEGGEGSGQGWGPYPTQGTLNISITPTYIIRDFSCGLKIINTIRLKCI